MDLLSRRTEQGLAFHTDARLRPDGEKGLLVNTLDAYEEYYRRRAMLWEIQALSRARPVAGDLEVGRAFHRLARALADFRPSNTEAGFPVPADGQLPGPPRRRGRSATESTREAVVGLAAYQPGWQKEIANMRSRIEKERTPLGKEQLAIKTGAGGLIDAEFSAQILCLANG